MRLHTFMAILAAWRFTELFMQDEITSAIRRLLPWKFWGCARCVSVWAGGAALALLLTVPYLNWPFALSWLYLVQGRAQEAIFRGMKKYVRIDMAGDGNIEVFHNNMNLDEARNLIAQVAGHKNLRSA